MAILIAAAWPAPAAAQSLNLSLNSRGTAPPGAIAAPPRRLNMPVIDYVAPDGQLSLRRGMVAGIDVAPSMTFGLGFFEGAPKRRPGAPDPAKPERASKRAAVGFSLKF